MTYLGLTKEEATELYDKELRQYKKFQAEKFSLDMSRGKPSKEQLEMTADIFDTLTSQSDFLLENGADARNYGGLDGISEMRRLFANLFDVSENKVMAGDESSLNIMYNLVQNAMQFGVGGELPWNKNPNVKFICLVPGYDRHFAITEHFGIKMIAVPFKDNGDVDIDIIEGLAASDSSIKGIWCVPKYSNPTGTTYSDEVVDRLAAMPAAKDFRIFWDNAYSVHGIYGDTFLKNIIDSAEAAGNPDRVYMFASTSKITMAGAGVSAFISSENNLKEYKSHLKFATIGPNKVNQLAHFRYLKSVENIYKIMNKHGDLLRPKFDCVYNILSGEFEADDILRWTHPVGGYFISVDVMKGSAKEVVDLSAKAGVKFTGAGASYPLKNDDLDRNIRLAPSYPSVDELTQAMQVFACAVKLSALGAIMREKE